MPQIDPTHQHFASQIIQDANPHTPIDPNGGGSIAVTDGTTTVDSATSIVMPAGTVSNLGGGAVGMGLVYSLQEAECAFDTPGFVMPIDDGPELFHIPAGSRFTVRAYVTTSFNQTGQVYVVAGEASGSHTMFLAKWDGRRTIFNQNAFVIASSLADYGSEFQGMAQQNHDDMVTATAGDWAAAADLVNGNFTHATGVLANALAAGPFELVALQDCVVAASFIATGDNPTAGAVTIDCIIATPAA